MSLTLLADANGNVLIFKGLLNGLDKFNGVADPSVNDATGDAELLNEDETGAGFTKPAFIYIAGSTGNYYAQVPDDWAIVAGTVYKVRVILVGDVGEKLDGIYEVSVIRRTS